jgi:hypothetical protein
VALHFSVTTASSWFSLTNAQLIADRDIEESGRLYYAQKEKQDKRLNGRAPPSDGKLW